MFLLTLFNGISWNLLLKCKINLLNFLGYTGFDLTSTIPDSSSSDELVLCDESKIDFHFTLCKVWSFNFYL